MHAQEPMSRKLVLIAAAGGLIAVSTGCTGDNRVDAGLLGAAVGTVAGVGASVLGANDTESILIGGVVAAVVAGARYYQLEAEERKANEREEELARKEAERMSKGSSDTDRVAMKEEDAKYAVKVGETENTVDLMVVDPDTNEPVDDTVYTVEKDDLDNKAIETAEVPVEPQRTPRDMRSPSDTSRAPDPPDPTEETDSVSDAPAAKADTGEITDETREIKFIKLSSHKVIYSP